MPSFILYPLSFLVVLGIMIVVHEWGHYAAAKAVGAFGVEVFFRRPSDPSPRLPQRRITDYRISGHSSWAAT